MRSFKIADINHFFQVYEKCLQLSEVGKETKNSFDNKITKFNSLK